MPNVAQLSITVTSFQENASVNPEVGALCAAEKPVISSGPNNSGPQNAEGQVLVRANGTIAVNRTNPAQAPVKLVFTLISPAGTSLSPTGIVFKQKNLNDDPNGSNNFRNATAAGSKLTIENHWVSHGKSNDNGVNRAPSWKYSIRVRNAAGQLGWIDPGIENSED